MLRVDQFNRFSQIARELLVLYRAGCELHQTYPLLRRWQEILNGMSEADRQSQPWIVLDMPLAIRQSFVLHTYHPTKADWNFCAEWMPGELSKEDEEELRNHLIEMLAAWLRVGELTDIRPESSEEAPLTPSDRDILSKMLELGADHRKPMTQADIITETTGGLSTKGMFDTLKKSGLIEAKKNVGTYLTTKGVETAKYITGK